MTFSFRGNYRYHLQSATVKHILWPLTLPTILRNCIMSFILRMRKSRYGEDKQLTVATQITLVEPRVSSL